MSSQLKVLILAGGGGVRLWPYSTERLPKQFITIRDRQSSFAQSVERALFVSSEENVFISSNAKNFPHIKRQLRNTRLDTSHVIVKDEDYETGLSIFVSLKKLKEQFGADDSDVIVVLPSDHFIEPLEKFKEAIEAAALAASGSRIVALGKKPLSPQESFGYISLGEKQKGQDFYPVKQFIEKPPREVAEKLIKQGSCLWNLGIYVFPVGLMIQEFENYLKTMGINDLENSNEALTQASSLSFDKMIAEHSKNLVAIEASFEWLDMGSWKAFHGISDKDSEGNVTIGDHILSGTERSLIIGDEKPIVAIQVEDLLIIDHRDAFLVIPESHVDALKKAMPLIKERYPHLARGIPFVSVCTPLFNQEQPVGFTAESVLTQTYPAIEHIIVHSGSREEDEKLRERIKIVKDRLHVRGDKVTDIIREPNTANGPYAVLNSAVREATGEIITTIDADDVYADATAVETMVNAMEKENADVAWGDLVYVKEDDLGHMTRFWQSSSYRKGLFKKGWMPPHPTFFVRRWVYEKYGYFRTDLPLSASYEFMLRTLEKEGLKGCYVPKIVVKVREGSDDGMGGMLTTVKANIECYRSWKMNGLSVQPWFVFMKPLTKFTQLFTKSRPISLQ